MDSRSKLSQTVAEEKENKQELAKKRPSCTKLDLERMFEESIVLQKEYQQLLRDNEKLKEKFAMVECAKANRQNLIATVQKLVDEKAQDLHPRSNASWLVFKLNRKICQLRSKIMQKGQAIQQARLCPESQALVLKQAQVDCLKQVIGHLKTNGYGQLTEQIVENEVQMTQKKGEGLSQGKRQSQGKKQSQGNRQSQDRVQAVKEIVWMQQQLQNKEKELVKAEAAYRNEQRQLRCLQSNLSVKKAHLCSIKQMEHSYNQASQAYHQEKRKKELRMAGNKTCIEDLLVIKSQRTAKLTSLKERMAALETEEKAEIDRLQQELHDVRNQAKEKFKDRQSKECKEEVVTVAGKKKWSRRVKQSEVKDIANNLNYMLALRTISLETVGEIILNEGSGQPDGPISLLRMNEVLAQWPFVQESQQQRMLLARYLVQDSGDGLVLLDMSASQSASVVKSVFCRLLGSIRLYSPQETTSRLQQMGAQLARLAKLVQSNIYSKEGTLKKMVSRAKMEEAVQSAQIFTSTADIEFLIFYLFSWSRDIDKLQIARLEMLKNGQGLNWDHKTGKERRLKLQDCPKAQETQVKQFEQDLNREDQNIDGECAVPENTSHILVSS